MKSWPRFLVISLAVTLAVAGPAKSQSLYGCRDLAGAHFPALEGDEGVFFRVNPDMLTLNRLSNGIVDQFGRLAKTLSDHGTTLVLLPMPTKALVMPDQLGPYAVQYGYDPVLAATIYSDTLARLDAAGVTLVDVRNTLQQTGDGTPSYFRADSRLNNTGLLALARAISHHIGGETTTDVRAENPGMTTLISTERLSLQARCLLPLPEVSSSGLRFEVGNDLDAVSLATPQRVVLASTGLTGDSNLNFSHYLTALSGLPVERISVADDAIAAAAAVLTSDEFQQARPDFLIWELPLWNNPGVNGDQPFRELIAAAKDDCEQPLEGEITQTGRLRVQLPELEQPQRHTILLNTGDQPARRADFHFFSADGLARTRSVVRNEHYQSAGRFFMPMTGLWPEGASYVEFETDLIENDSLEVALCAG